MSKNIALVGFMGAGKSVVAMNLAVRLKREVVSTDALIVEREERSIADIFKDSGEAYFRELEKKVVAEISQKSNLVIDCGGGVVIKQENIDVLKKNGILIYLKTSPEVIYERIKEEKHRPLLSVSDPKAKIKELLKARESQYAQAHHTVETSHKTVEEAVREILTLIPHE